MVSDGITIDRTQERSSTFLYPELEETPAGLLSELRQYVDEFPEELERWFRLLDLTLTRRQLHQKAHGIVCVFGPTGVGKSTLFNIMAGALVSPAGAVRPFTSQPVAVGTQAAVEACEQDVWLSQSEPPLRFETLPELALGREDLLLIDTPDFDSVEIQNRRIAEWIFLRADFLIVVATPEKYGDASLWEMVDRFQPLGTIGGVLFNKSDSEVSLVDFRSDVASKGLPEPMVVERSPEFKEEGIAHPNILGACKRLIVPLRELESWRTSLQKSVYTEEKRVRDQVVSPWLRQTREIFRDLASRVAKFEASLPRRIEEELALELDSALRKELELIFQREVQRIDILRGPREWIGAPVRWLTQWVSKPRSDKRELESTTEWLERIYTPKYEEFVLNLVLELEELVSRTQSQAHNPLPQLTIPEEPIESTKGRLGEAFRELEATIRAETTKIAEGLPLAGKVSFYGSQILFHSMFTAVCLKTGGLLSPAELATQSLISPFIAKVLGNYVSSQEASTVEDRLRKSFESSILESIEPILEPIRGQLELLQSLIPAAEEWQAFEDEWDAYG